MNAAAAAGAAFAAGVIFGRGCWLVPEPEPEPEPEMAPASRCEPPPRADLEQEAQSLLQKISELQATNRQLAQGHQRLAAIPPPLDVPPPPLAPPQLPAPPASVVRLTQELERRRAGGARRRKKRREPLTIDSAYDVGGDGGRPEQVKEEMNAAVCEALRRCGDDLEAWIAQDTRHLLLLIDSPALLSTAALLKQWPGLANSQQIVIPQYDLSHYVQMITSDRSGGYVGVRLQRLDQWLCTNARRGFRCRLFLADVESAFLGHQNRQLCPADDLLRYLRWGYAADRSVLVLTFDLRSEFPAMEDVEAFVVHEAGRCGLRADCTRRWRYGLGCLLFELRRTSETSES
eukprot:COSAG04_NODE_801_length_10193_cov_5.092530_5_plen_346_part_00